MDVKEVNINPENIIIKEVNIYKCIVRENSKDKLINIVATNIDEALYKASLVKFDAEVIEVSLDSKAYV